MKTIKNGQIPVFQKLGKLKFPILALVTLLGLFQCIRCLSNQRCAIDGNSDAPAVTKSVGDEVSKIKYDRSCDYGNSTDRQDVNFYDLKAAPVRADSAIHIQGEIGGGQGAPRPVSPIREKHITDSMNNHRPLLGCLTEPIGGTQNIPRTVKPSDRNYGSTVKQIEIGGAQTVPRSITGVPDIALGFSNFCGDVC
jgi:hypothetical protein